MSDNKEIDLTNVLGEPKVYKGIEIYPVKIREYEKFTVAIRCLLFEKNKTNNIEILKMSYLKFILMLINNGHEYLINHLEELFKLVLKRDFYIDIDEKGRVFIIFNVVENEQEKIVRWTENDFDKVKKIIFKQNLIQLDEAVLDPELEKKLREAREFMNRRNGKMADLEQQIVAYHCAFQIGYDEISNLTVYQFHKGLERMSHMKNADAFQKGMYSGFMSIKDNTEIPNWLSYIEESDPNSDIIMSKGEFDRMTIEKGLVNE